MAILVHAKDRLGDSYLMQWSGQYDAPDIGKRWEPTATSSHPVIDRVIRFGSSRVGGESARQVIYHNRAGRGETTLTYDQMIDFYCTRAGTGPMPVGIEGWRMESDALDDWYCRNWPADLHESTFGEPDPHSDARQGVAVAVVRNGCILLGKRLNCIDSGEWQMPGGKPEAGEFLRHAAIRELQEETGLVAAAAPRYVCAHVARLSDGLFLRTHYFLIDVTGDPKNIEPTKCEGWNWMPLAEPPEPLFATNARAIAQVSDVLGARRILGVTGS